MSLANTIALATIATQASTNASRPSQARLGPSSGGAEATSRPAQTTAGAKTPGISQVQSVKAPAAAVTSTAARTGASPRSRPRNRRAAARQSTPTNVNRSATPGAPSSAASWSGSECGLRTKRLIVELVPQYSSQPPAPTPWTGLSAKALAADFQNCQRPLELNLTVPVGVLDGGAAVNSLTLCAGPMATTVPAAARTTTASSAIATQRRTRSCGTQRSAAPAIRSVITVPTPTQRDIRSPSARLASAPLVRASSCPATTIRAAPTRPPMTIALISRDRL